MIGQVLGGYRIEALLGAGGMGRVYRARSVAGGKAVALKVLPVQSSADDVIERMKREAMALDSLSHPGIVAFRGLVVTPHHLCYAMDHLDGVDLDAYLNLGGEKRHAPDLDELHGLAEEIAGALAHAHDHGVLHRDVKPGNVMVCRDGRLVLVDFGLAKISDLATLTGRGEVVGTVEYFAPEQMRGDALSPATDVYQLGLLLWEAAAGDLPFDGTARPMEGAIRRCRKDCPPLRTKRPDLPIWFETVVSACLRRDPEERVASARRLLELLESGGGASRAGRAREIRAGRVARLRVVEAGERPATRRAISLVAVDDWRRAETRRVRRDLALSPLHVALAGFLVTLLLGLVFLGFF